MISKTSLHIIQALVELSTLSTNQVEGVGVIAKKIHAPENYLAKLLQQLAKQGIVISKKGLNGGFRLNKLPSDIHLYDVIASLEDVTKWQGCLMNKGACSKAHPCAAHEKWAKARNAYLAFLQQTSIADLG